MCVGGGGGGRDRELIVSFEATHQQSVEPLRELGVARELDLQQLATEVQQQPSLALERHLGALEVVYAAGFLVLYRTRIYMYGVHRSQQQHHHHHHRARKDSNGPGELGELESSSDHSIDGDGDRANEPRVCCSSTRQGTPTRSNRKCQPVMSYRLQMMTTRTRTTSSM